MHRRLLPTALFATFTACAGTPEPGPLPLPTLETGARYFAGTVLTGRRPDVGAADRLSADDACEVRCDVTFVERMPWDALDAVATRTRLIVSSRGADPLLPAPDLGIGARIGSADAAEEFLAQVNDGTVAGRSVPVFEFRGAVCPGVTTSFFAQSIDVSISDDGEAVKKLVSLMVGREEDAATGTVAVQFEDLAPETMTIPTDDQVERPPVVKRQMILLEDELQVDGPPIAIVIPSPFDPDTVRAFVVRVELRSVAADDPMLAEALAQCADDLRREGQRATEDAAWITGVEQRSRAVAQGLKALDIARNHRPILVFLAGQGDAAPLALDLALSGDETTLAAWTELVDQRERDALAAGGGSSPDVAWMLERTAFELLGQRLDRDDLSIELSGMLARHAGEAGRFPGTITGLIARATDGDSFHAMLVEENLGFLEAPDPSARVRAFDWLANRGLAPAGYDPLASREERDTALDAFRTAQLEAAR